MSPDIFLYISKRPTIPLALVSADSSAKGVPTTICGIMSNFFNGLYTISSVTNATFVLTSPEGRGWVIVEVG